ncbi:MAG TPA: immunoglobulin domain-containing protein, partial [Methylomirabilota bacterium]|nr:immunoglobulin domain-containing protein [Methylomirabilota bacterium]
MKPSGPWHQAATRQRWRAPWRCLVTAVAAGCLLMPGESGAQVLRDNFADRDILTSPQGQLDGDNTGATLETGEPRHGGKPGGHSLWISWIAPTNGVVKFETGGSSFDTLLSAYFFASTNDTALEQLVELARADDSEGFGFESEVTFGVLAGRRYEIAVDGYHGAAGPLELEWDFQPTAVPPPIILSVPGDRAVRPGDSVTLEVGLANAANGRYRWFHNDTELESQETTLVIPAFQAAHVGRYKLRVTIDGPGYYSVPIEIQINSDGAADSLARDKTFDALGSPLRPARVGGGGGLWPAGV